MMDEEMLKIKSERDEMSPDSLDYLVDTYLLKERAYPDRKFEVLNEFCQRFFNLPKHEISSFPNL